MRVINGGKNKLILGENESIKLSPLEIQDKGKVMRITLVTIGPEEGLTTGQAAELFQITESTVRKHLDRHAICSGLLVLSMLQLLKTNGVIHSKASQAIFIPRQGLRDLMRVVDTDEAKAAYHQLFDDAEEYFKIKPRYLAQEQLLKEKEEQIAQFKIENQELRKLNEDLKAAAEAFERHIKGKPSKKRNFEVVVRTEHRVNMFGERDDVIHIEKKPLVEMSEREKKGWCAQHTTKVGRGMIRKAASFYENSQDKSISNAAKGACVSVDSFYETLWPEDARVESSEKE